MTSVRKPHKPWFVVYIHQSGTAHTTRPVEVVRSLDAAVRAVDRLNDQLTEEQKNERWSHYQHGVSRSEGREIDHQLKKKSEDAP